MSMEIFKGTFLYIKTSYVDNLAGALMKSGLKSNKETKMWGT